MTENSHSLSEALRKDRARKILPKWISELRAAISHEVSEKDFVDVHETLRLKSQFYELVRRHDGWIRAEWEHERWNEVYRTLKTTTTRLGNVKAVLFSRNDDVVGAIIVPAAVVLARAEAVWNIVGEDLSLATLDLKHGLCLERNSYDVAGKYHPEGVYLLTRWGVFSSAPCPT